MNYSCPVCGKAGLSDYRKEHIICPQCNSDLKAYLLIDKLVAKAKPSKNSFKKLFFLTLGLLMLICSYALVKSNSFAKEKKYSNNQISILQDSITFLNSNLIIEQPEVFTDIEHQFNYIYKVKKGDYPAMIASYFYNDWKMYKKIELDNNLIQPYVLKVGQPIIIKLNKE